MAARVIQVNETNRCDLCGYRSEGRFLDRVRHLKSEHPQYAKGLLFRVAAPGIFLIEVLVMAAVRSSPASASCSSESSAPERSAGRPARRRRCR